MQVRDANTNMVLTQAPIEYGSKLFFKSGDMVNAGDKISEWDAFNSVIVCEVNGTLRYKNLQKDVTYREEHDDITNNDEKFIIETKDHNKIPEAEIVDAEGNVIRSYALPVRAHLMKDDGEENTAGEIFVKIPRMSSGGAGDITGGLPRVTELFEARNPSNPAIVS